jgi:hypothetical protein
LRAHTTGQQGRVEWLEEMVLGGRGAALFEGVGLQRGVQPWAKELPVFVCSAFFLHASLMGQQGRPSKVAITL